MLGLIRGASGPVKVQLLRDLRAFLWSLLVVVILLGPLWTWLAVGALHLSVSLLVYASIPRPRESAAGEDKKNHPAGTCSPTQDDL